MTVSSAIKSLEAELNKARTDAKSAEMWVSLHQWVFLPIAFVSGLVIGAVWL